MKDRVTLTCAAGLCAVLLAGCEAPGTTSTRNSAQPAAQAGVQGGTEALEAQIAEVTQALIDLGPAIDPSEAARAAEIAVRAPPVWAQEWRVVDSPLVHNVKVVNGLRERGVCQDFADALQRALVAENFRTLQLHRGWANARNVKLEHVTVIVTAPGQPMEEGLILDNWRVGQGRLWFGPVSDDPRYTWESAAAVHAWKAEMRARARAQN